MVETKSVEQTVRNWKEGSKRAYYSGKKVSPKWLKSIVGDEKN